MLYIEPYNLEIIIKRYNKRLFNSQQRYMDQVNSNREINGTQYSLKHISNLLLSKISSS